jgi:hypothetical protein
MNYTLNTVKDLETINHRASYIGHKKRGNWEYDAWIVSIYPVSTPDTNGQSFEYSTGLGHRNKNKAVKPKLADVLYSLTFDAYASQTSFDDWCSEFGYDTDSRKALDMYLQCQESDAKLRKVLSHENIAQITKLLEDY